MPVRVGMGMGTLSLGLLEELRTGGGYRVAADGLQVCFALRLSSLHQVRAEAVMSGPENLALAGVGGR